MIPNSIRRLPRRFLCLVRYSTGKFSGFFAIKALVGVGIAMLLSTLLGPMVLFRAGELTGIPSDLPPWLHTNEHDADEGERTPGETYLMGSSGQRLHIRVENGDILVRPAEEYKQDIQLGGH